MELRRFMPIAEWPETDRDLWERVSNPHDFFADHIARPAHWRARTRHKGVTLYGRWLTFIVATGRLVPGQHPATGSHERLCAPTLRCCRSRSRAGQLGPM